MSQETPLLEVRNLKKHFPIRKGFFSRVVGTVKAVDGISFTLNAGETLGMVGESGCGKTTAGRTLLRLLDPTDGEALFEGKDIFKMPPDELRELRKNMQIIFQDPYSSLNPRLNVETIIGEALKVHGIMDGQELRDRVVELVEKVGLLPSHLGRFPHEFSGGQRQRIGIARSLATRPDLIIADEPVSALDVSVQAQVVNLLAELQKEFGLTYLFIAHDLSIVYHIADKIAVMYLGNLVEYGTAEQVYKTPKHPYSKALISAVPQPNPDGKREKRTILKGDI
ncbi:MAG: ABC transporter ATP-binding protein, partial [Proteobacteria bacterium]|nr:ABC transporter ATP-binding protein [Pseudomonadota bacterium]